MVTENTFSAVQTLQTIRVTGDVLSYKQCMGHSFLKFTPWTFAWSSPNYKDWDLPTSPYRATWPIPFGFAWFSSSRPTRCLPCCWPSECCWRGLCRSSVEIRSGSRAHEWIPMPLSFLIPLTGLAVMIAVWPFGLVNSHVTMYQHLEVTFNGRRDIMTQPWFTQGNCSSTVPPPRE